MKYAQKENFELSFNQKRFWFLNNENFTNLYTQISVKFLYQVDVEKLKAVLNRVISTHETLSSRLILDESSVFPLQSPFHFEAAWIENLPVALYEDWISNHTNNIVNADLETALPIQFFTFSNSQNNVTGLVFRVYTFWTDLFGGYKILDNIIAGLADNQIVSSSDESFIVHKKFSVWQNELIVGKDNEGLDFWSNYLCDPGKKVIPFGKKSAAVFLPHKINLFEIKGERFLKLFELLEEKAINVELHFATGIIDFLQNYEESRLTLGYTLFSRIYDVLNETVGLVCKTVPLEINEHFNVNDKESIQNLLDDIQKVKDWSDYYGANSHDGNPENLKFKICFQYIDATQSFKNLRMSNCLIEDVFSVQDTFEIKLSITKFWDRLNIELYYDVNRFTDVEISVIKDQILNSLRKIAIGPYFEDKNSDVIPKILNRLNSTNVKNIDLSNSILDLIQKQVELQPGVIAIESESDHITYLEFWKRTDSLANYLISTYGDVKGRPIGVLLNSSLDYVISIFGILKTGAFFVPLDSLGPESRINFVLKDCNCGVLITEEIFGSKIDFSGKFLFYEQVWKLNTDSAHDLQISFDIAYVIYTSGSSGFPKGVVISHRSLANYILWAKEYYLESGDLGNSGLFTSFSFDLTLTSIFVPLVNGKTIYTQNQNLSISEKIIGLFQNPQIDLIKLTPSHINLLVALNIDVKGAKIIIVGGEALTSHQVEILYKLIPDVRIYNEYGPTEATIGCIVKQININDRRILIGHPISNTRIKIVGKRGECSVGGIGEILIGGECLSVGYLNNPEESNRSFFFDEESGNRFYRSGDLGRILPNGELEYIGRKDDQIKVRGYRVELGEIEYHIKNHHEISDAVVIYKKNESDEGALLVFIVSSRNFLSSELRDLLKPILPDYMIPQHCLRIDEIPLTRNGKIDRNSLADRFDQQLESTVEYIAPRNEIEEKLVKIWEEVFQREGIGVKHDFYCLGGHSLKAIAIVKIIHREFSIKIELKEVFEKSSIELMSELIAREVWMQKNTLPPKAVLENNDESFIL